MAAEGILCPGCPTKPSLGIHVPSKGSAKFSTICFALAECLLKISLFLYNSHNFWGLWEPFKQSSGSSQVPPKLTGRWLSLYRQQSCMAQKEHVPIPRPGRGTRAVSTNGLT
ncbi:hypothetical protein H8959_021567 [Pygathrix nigripes]